MDSWPTPPVPRLAGQGLPLRVFDTATQQLLTTKPGPTARLYVCGITPYDATHLGHAATYIAFDLMQRVWLDAGHDVHYVQNVTDVDDPLLERAVATGQDWSELARAETALFRQDMTALRVLPPQDYVGAVESIPSVVRLVLELQNKGAAYAVDDDIYFSVASDPRFGSLSRLNRESMVTLLAERGGDPDRPGKKDPLDSLLWQAARPGEPAWETTLGHGRPGWHIECAAIALDQLGMTFDVQGGGSDLIFPHHETGASEAHVITGEWPFAQAFVHTGMVGLSGAKMSKSQGNLVFVSRLLDDGRDPMAVRLALLAHHYRANWDWTEQDLTAAEARLHHWRIAVTSGAAPSADAVIDAIRHRLADDLDAPGALAAIDAWADHATDGAESSSPGDGSGAGGEVAAAVDALLGVQILPDA